MLLEYASAEYNLEEYVMLEPYDELNQSTSPTTDQYGQQILAYFLESR